MSTTKTGFDPALYQRIQLARRMELARLAARRMQLARMTPAAVAASGAGAGGGGAEPEPPAPGPTSGFLVDGVHAETMAEAIRLVNASEGGVSKVLLCGNIDLDETDAGADLPALTHSFDFDLQGHEIKTNGAFSRGSSCGYGWGDRLFRIQLPDSAEQPAVSGSIRNGSVKAAVSGTRTGFLYTESTLPVNLKDLTIDWDLTGVPGGYGGRMGVIGYCGSSGAVLENVKCAVVGHDQQGCFEAQTFDDLDHPEYVFRLAGCEFSQKSVDQTASANGRSTRTGAVFAGQQVTIDIDGGRYSSDNGYCTLGTFSSGASLNVGGGAEIASTSSPGCEPGPAFRGETANGSRVEYDISDAVARQDSGKMFAWSHQAGSFANPAVSWTIGGGEFYGFSPETNSNTSTSIEGGSFDADVAGYCAPGRTCSWDEDAGMWKVA